MVRFNTFSAERFPFLNADILQSRNLWSIRLRWLAVAMLALAVVLARYVFALALPYVQVISIIAILVIVNLIYYLFLRWMTAFSFRSELVVMYVHIIVDLLLLTLLIHYLGGLENPFFFFYIFHVVISSIVFPRRVPFVIATLAVLMFAIMVWLEYTGLINHYSLFNAQLYTNKVMIYLVLTVFVITIYVSTYIGTTFMHIYRQAKRDIDEKNNQLLAADHQKSQFFRFTSHELKSPVIAIKTTIDGVLNSATDIDEKYRHLLQRASGRAAQMLDILKELLELSHSRKRRNQPVDLVLLLGECVEMESNLAVSGQVTVQTEISRQPLFIDGDAHELQKVLQNLISNAVRYTPPGGTVRVSLKDEKDAIQFSVTDNGIGIDKKDLPHIFDEFFRSEQARKTVHFGTGLGLSLVKQIVGNYGGEIDVRSEPGRQTVFKVRMPKNAERNTG